MAQITNPALPRHMNYHFFYLEGIFPHLGFLNGEIVRYLVDDSQRSCAALDPCGLAYAHGTDLAVQPRKVHLPTIHGGILLDCGSTE